MYTHVADAKRGKMCSTESRVALAFLSQLRGVKLYYTYREKVTPTLASFHVSPLS